MGKDSEREPTDNRLVVIFMDDGRINLRTEGPGVSPDQLVLAAHYIRRTADQLLDGAQQAPAQGQLVRAASLEGINGKH